MQDCCTQKRRIATLRKDKYQQRKMPLVHIVQFKKIGIVKGAQCPKNNVQKEMQIL